ncbi:ATP-binding protein [uncultured Cohaesibacter sp.]|uniref:ATP-binding protein n=1 Tax=uncultured Cohaesibacter sp. TaxID=1002546 RepID=UPI0029C66209|nr:ATP-binding protein [uncultured Cohaesibacter sp.]
MKSITRYLVVNISIWALLAALGAGVFLTSLFRSAAENSFDEQLDIVLKVLVGNLATQLFSSEELSKPDNLGQPRFELPLSGWYWTVSKVKGDELLYGSLSLGGENFSIETESAKQYTGGIGRYLLGRGPDQKKIRILERQIAFGPDQSYYIRVTGNAEELNAQVSQFQNRAWLLMALFGAVLLIVSLLLVRSALKPLGVLQKKVRDVANGNSLTIVGDYPVEVAGLVEEANILISSNQETLERARTQLGNLAHALKTPLSVITNEVRSSGRDNADLLVQQVAVMRDQIQLYLDRARFAARHNTIGKVTDVSPILQKMASVMGKIHPGIDVALLSEDTDKISFRGEAQDLEEMIGNLVDNACKWAKTQVVISLYPKRLLQHDVNETKPRSITRNWLTIIVEDDGHGLAEAEIEIALKRGLRLDESKPGSGLGLSIVSELAGLYRGEFALSRSELGGLQATLVLPAYKE